MWPPGGPHSTGNDRQTEPMPDTGLLNKCECTHINKPLYTSVNLKGHPFINCQHSLPLKFIRRGVSEPKGTSTVFVLVYDTTAASQPVTDLPGLGSMRI